MPRSRQILEFRKTKSEIFWFYLVLCMRLITENKWKQGCGVRRYDLGLRKRSHRLMFRVICERIPLLAGGWAIWHHRNMTGALHHHQQMEESSLSALALFSQEIRLGLNFSTGGPGVPYHVPKEQCQSSPRSCGALVPMGSLLPLYRESSHKERKGSFLIASFKKSLYIRTKLS